MQRPAASVAIVVPWIHGLRGHRIAIDLAHELAAQGLRTDFFTGRIFRELSAVVAANLGAATFHSLGTLDTGQTSILRFARYQYSRGLDRQLARAVAQRHAATPFDLVFVISNEGHWLPTYLRRYIHGRRPKTAVCVREMVEHPFMLGYERPWRLARTLLSWSYPLVHTFEAERLKEFDLVFANSPWTSTLLDYFYGIRASPTLAMVDRPFFEVELNRSPQGYIAVPTASLDEQGVEILQQVHHLLPNLRTYGPRAIAGIPHAGFLPEADRPSFLGFANATLYLFNYEALGLIPLESLAAGTPVVTVPKQGPFAVLADNPYVRFARTPDQFAAACTELAQLASDPKWRAGCRASVARFHPEQATETFLTELQRRNVVGSRPEPASH